MSVRAYSKRLRLLSQREHQKSNAARETFQATARAFVSLRHTAFLNSSMSLLMERGGLSVLFG
jgi:hypothetical protein